MELLLNVKTRMILGKKVKSLRDQGLVPAELYGHKIANQHLSVLAKEFNKIYKLAGENTIVYLVNEKNEKTPVLISEVEINPIKQKIYHADFHQVKMDEKMKIKVPVHFVDEAPAQKAGFVLVKVTDEIEVEALPSDIPHSFDVSLATLEKPGDGIHLSNLKMSKGVKLISDPEALIVTITEQMKEEVMETPVIPPSEVPATEQKSPEEIAAETTTKEVPKGEK